MNTAPNYIISANGFRIFVIQIHSVNMDSVAAAATSFFLKSSTARTKLQMKNSTRHCFLLSGRYITSFFPTHQRAPVPSSRISNSLQTRCSKKPGIGKNSATNSNPAIEVQDSSLTSPQEVSTETPSNQALLSTFSIGLVFDLGSKTSWDIAEIG
ncbi:LOW QUALITY PROTEIN: hypothetical protein TorRG33x02_007010 [Trema orientale]|uniref:Uncharacterized protein n=1 Tax=Trema orientale TaxID=63057 RepID=A0A2P5G0D1_TREOI|nr:LOW QUALITY PROTEIN: hypothetical protein TorRG33x02_007010 [Trema orientale]